MKSAKWIAGVGLLFVLALGVYNALGNCKFFEASFSTCLSLAAVIGISFLLSQKLTDRRKQRDIMLKVAESLKDLVDNPAAYHLPDDVSPEDITTRNRDISNRITTLEQYGKKLGVAEEVAFIRQKFTEYEEFTGDHIKKLSYLRDSEKELRRPLELICQKLYDLMIKLYE